MKIPKTLSKSLSPSIAYHGLSTTSRVLNGILENTLCRFIVSPLTVQPYATY